MGAKERRATTRKKKRKSVWGERRTCGDGARKNRFGYYGGLGNQDMPSVRPQTTGREAYETKNAERGSSKAESKPSRVE